jgi:squalene-hopene/tetraprenyl-beta-curcumene cyclase
MIGLSRLTFFATSIGLAGVVILAVQSHQSARASDTVIQRTWSKTAASQYITERAQWWLGWSGSARGQGTACISCHTSLPIALAQPALGKEMGEPTEGAVEKALIDDVSARVGDWNDIVTTNDWSKCVAYYSDQKPAALGTESVMNALVLVNHDRERSRGVLSPATEAALKFMWQQQQPDGSWRWLEFGLRPWESDGVYYGAALAAVASGMAGKDYNDRPNIQANLTELRGYLVSHYAMRPLHDQLACLWASSYLPNTLDTTIRKQLIQQLYSIQNADGGWSLNKLGAQTSNPGGWSTGGTYPAGSVSDGFATGLAVLALKRDGVSSHSPSLERAVSWLNDSENDGTWPTNFLNGARDLSTPEGGFMQDASTSFAILALTEPAHG